LEVYAQVGAGKPKKLTPNGEFEYLPKTNDSHVAAYRQSGGVVLYDLDKNERKIISETGAPNDIDSHYIVAQGIGIEGGIGGGIWLYDLARRKWKQVSDVGDSARLDSNRIVWQEFEDGTVVVKHKYIDTDEPAVTLVKSASQPSPSGERVAWVDWNSSNPGVHVSDFSGKELYFVQDGSFPHLMGDVVAYLVIDGQGFSLAVDDVVRKRNILTLPNVGSPIGAGPILSNDAIYFESKGKDSLNVILKSGFSY